MKNEGKSARVINAAFFVLTALIFGAGLLRTLLFPKEINDYENRYAAKVSAPSPGAYLDGSFQSGMEDALSDQVQLSTFAKHTYNRVDAAIAKMVIDRAEDGQIVRYNGMNFLNDYIIYGVSRVDYIKDSFDARAENLNALFSSHSELEFYLYYVEKDTDIDFLTGEKPGIYPYLSEQIALPAEHKAAFTVNSFADFSEYFYKTDHHWNCRGSYKAYTELVSLLRAGEPLKPAREVQFDAVISGSKALGAREVFYEPFSAYDFDFPEMSVSINGAAAGDYGGVWSWFSDPPSGYVSYAGAYGGDDGEIVFDTRSGGENLLVIGESYDNAVLKLLASHFGTLHSVDLRYYEHCMGKSFDFDAYVEENDIDKVLLIGNIDYFNMPDFMIGGR